MDLTIMPFPKVQATALTAKLRRIMKITAALLLIGCLQVSARGLGQSVTLSFKEATLKKVFIELNKQTGCNFFYSDEVLLSAKKVSVQVKNVSLAEVLQICFRDQPLEYSIENNAVVVKRKAIPRTPLFNPPLIDIQGRIVNENGEPVSASILVKGTTSGTSSNASGYFELKNIADNAVLVISGVGIESIEVPVNGRKELSIRVKIKAGEEDEVVVKTNYWETKRKLNPGNISKVSSKEIEKSPVSNPLAAIIGRVPGLEIVQQSGLPGGNFQVRIRGLNSIANGNDPLFVVDGVPFTSTTMSNSSNSQDLFWNGTSPLNGINPADIESIEVLKDADATAIYGSRGSNGVILITTKRGRVGKSKVDVNFYRGAGRIANKLKMMNAQQYRQMRFEGYKNAGIWPVPPGYALYAPDLYVWDSTRTIDWQEELLGGTAETTDAQVSFSGGNENTQYLLGAGYHKENGVFPGDNWDRRLSTHLNVNNVSLNKKFRSSVSVKYSTNKTDYIRKDLTSIALTLPPVAPPLFKPNGDLNWSSNLNENGWVRGYMDHPLSYLKTSYLSNTKNLLLNGLFSYAITRNLELRVSAGFTDVMSDSYNTIPKSSLSPDEAAYTENQSIFSNSSFMNWTIEPQINWKSRLGGGRLDVLVGGSLLEQVQKSTLQTGIGYSVESLMNTIGAAANKYVSSSHAEYRYAAAYGRINYTYREKYVANLTGRRDGSSRFGPGKQFANFGAMGLAWIFSEENFIKRAFPFLNFGKLRGSMGVTGNDQLTNYQYLDTYTATGNYGTTSGLRPARLANSDFAWETNKKIEAGLELGFLNDRIYFAFSYYRNRSSNQLVGTPLPPSVGFETVQSNFPATVQNTGVEFELNTQNLSGKNFTWTSSVNFSIPRNKLVAFPNLASSPTYANTLVIGKPLSIVKRYNYQGVDPQTGVYQFEDVNKDGIINTRDRTVPTYIGVDFYGGMQNSFRYKSFQLDFLLQYVNHTTRSFRAIVISTPGGSITNFPVEVLDRWQKPGDITWIQKFSYTGPANTANSFLSQSTAAITDASFIRLRNVFLAWSVPERLAKKLGLQSARLFAQGQNLLTFSKFEGIDPEAGAGYSLPPLKVFSAGFNLSF